MNHVVIIGNLGRDPDVRKTQSGSTIARLNVATTYRGKGEPKTEWHRVTVFGRQAENCEQYLSRGSKVAIAGRIETSTYEKDGEKRYSTEIVAMSVEFLDPKGGGQSRGGNRPSDNYQAPSYAGPDGGDDDIPF